MPIQEPSTLTVHDAQRANHLLMISTRGTSLRLDFGATSTGLGSE